MATRRDLFCFLAMEEKHKNLRDVGLSLLHLRSGGACFGDGSSSSRSAKGDASPSLLPCGRLLRCGAIDNCSFDELRRPGTIVNVRMGPDDALDSSLQANGVVLLHVPAENSLEKYHTSDKGVQAWLQDVVRVFESSDIRFPVLLHCRSGKDRTGVAVALLLSLLGVPEPLIIKEFLLSAGAEEPRIKESLSGIRKAGGAAKYLSAGVQGGSGVDVEKVKSNLSVAAKASEETNWLRQEVELMCRLAHKATKDQELAAASYWRGQAAVAAGELATRVPPGEAAAALYYRGWALGQQEEHAAARVALSVGSALGRVGGAKEAVLKRIDKELAALPVDIDDEETEIQVLKKDEIDAPGNCHADLFLLDLPPDTGEEGSEAAAAPARWPWRALQCPPTFAWLRSGELAASVAPGKQHLSALQALGIQQRIDVELSGAAAANPESHWEKMVADVGKALAGGSACLVHCRDGFADSGVVLACFTVAYGLDDPVQEPAGQPKMTANEAVDVLRAMRPGSITSEREEEHVYTFAQNAWAKHIEKAQKAFTTMAAKAKTSDTSSSNTREGSASTASARMAPATARVVSQPGDGNCLFHSLAYGLGSGTASTLRSEICAFMEMHPDLSIAGTTLAEWVMMLAGSPIGPYAKKMAKGSQWGGAPEIAACAHMRMVNVHVYERRAKGFELTVPFDVAGCSKTVSVLYVGGVHYDALVM